jgi:hypothetical protein
MKGTVDYSIKYPWQQFVVEAFLEFHPKQLTGKLNIAERAISQRLAASLGGALDLEEQLALRDALIALRVLMPPKARAEEDRLVLQAARIHSGSP